MNAENWPEPWNQRLSCAIKIFLLSTPVLTDVVVDALSALCLQITAVGVGVGEEGTSRPLSHFSFLDTFTHLKMRPLDTVVAPSFLQVVPAIEVDAEVNEGANSKTKRVTVVTVTLFVSILKG